MFIDTHCHIHDKEYNFDPEHIIARAHANHVDKIITIGTSHADSLAARDFALSHPEVYWSYGLHPGEITQASSPSVPEEKESSSRPIAIGEIGLDYHYHPFDREQQITLFEQMLDLANTQNLPVIFHVREAFDDFWPIVDNAHVRRAVLHSFSDTTPNLQKALDRDFFVGVNGLATFAPIPLPPLERMLLETDAPFLTPVPFRGKVNEPAYVLNIAEWISNKTGVALSEVAAITTANACKLFGL